MAETEAPARRGRPPKYSDELAERIFIHLRCGASIRTASGAEGVSHDSIERWREQRPDFAAALERAGEEFKTNNLARMNHAAERGSVDAIKWLLERRGGPEFKEPAKQMEHKGDIDIHVIYDSTEPATD